MALELEVRVRSSARGERAIPAIALFAGPFATTIAPDEILTEIRLPAVEPSGASAYVALPQPASGYPIAGVAVALNGSCTIGVTGVGEQPYRAIDIERAVLEGTPFDDAVRTIATGQRVAADIHADREYRTAMAVVMARRAFAVAAARLDAFASDR